ncbi:MAG: amidophosphoribosyltransferase [Candidatus Omnitrophica bacterium]|nr:amidophosphoribosyltransferase [Candidatus Omnitrophota bacterium]
MCGIIGVSGQKNAAQIAFLGLYALQHRGEEAAGIATYDGKDIRLVKKRGLVADVFDDRAMQELQGTVAIGHCRYSTTGSDNHKNVQPFMVRHKRRPIAIAHNGNLTNTEQLYQRLEEDGSIFQTTMDSEIIVHLLAKSKEKDLKKSFVEVLVQLEGAYSLLFLVDDVLVGARDPHGVRPLCLGKLDGHYVMASESCSLDLLHAEYVREIEPGEIVFIKKDQIESVYLPGRDEAKKAHCIFENIYFARPDSNIFMDNVYQVRKRLGERLAKEHPVKADFVMSIPDSGNYAALGFAQELKLPFEVGLIRNHYIGRTFIQPTQFLRDFSVKVKLNPIREVLKGKKVVVVDDSIVRGTTSRNRVEALRQAGAKEVHMRISCPPIISPCFYGIDFPSKKELIASDHTVKEIADFIKVDSLAYLSLEGLLSEMKDRAHFCHACFSGEYPINIPKTQDKYLLEGKCCG